MAIARRLRWYLKKEGIEYEVLRHPYSRTSLEAAREAHVPPNLFAKPVLLEDERGYVMAIVPASRRIDLETLCRQLHRDLELASELEIGELFEDCDAGAMPPLGKAYQIPMVYDDALKMLPEVYFEAGDHEDVIHVHGRDFLRLLQGSLHGEFSAVA